jgi:hypothetical protein
VPDPADSEGPQPLHPTVEVRSAPHLRKPLFFKKEIVKKVVIASAVWRYIEEKETE